MIEKLAAVPFPTEVGTISFPPTPITSLEDLLITIFTWMLGFAGSLAVIAIIYSGVMYITSGGDAAKAEQAKKNLIWAIIGVVAIGLSYLIIFWVQEILLGHNP